MDLSTLDAGAEGAVMTVRHPGTDETLKDAAGNPVTLTLVGTDHAAYKKAQRQAIDRRLAKGNRAKTTAAALDEDNITTIACFTTAWSGVGLGGDDLPFSLENVKLAYERLPWLFEQANQFVGDRANFLKA